jgi:hypothetical protein
LFPIRITSSGWNPTPVIDCVVPLPLYVPAFMAWLFVLNATQWYVRPLRFTRLSSPTVKPLASSDWMLFATNAVSDPIGLDTSPAMLELRATPSVAFVSLTITKSGWKPTVIARWRSSRRTRPRPSQPRARGA